MGESNNSIAYVGIRAQGDSRKRREGSKEGDERGYKTYVKTFEEPSE